MTRRILDVETTIFQKGHPFADCNQLCLVGIRSLGHNEIYEIEYSGSPYGEQLARIDTILRDTSELVVFNAKNELHWLKRYGIDVTCPIFDCQLAAFILSNQRVRFPSLDGEAARLGLGQKIDVVKREYWDKGIDTPDIPKDILWPYLEQDLSLTDKVVLQQESALKESGRLSLFRLQ